MGYSVSTFSEYHTVEAVLLGEPTNVVAVAYPRRLVFEQSPHEITVTMKLEILVAASDLYDLVDI
jgi:hypothetical protein